MRSKIRVVGAMIEQDGRYLITQWSPRASFPLLWEFPGGRVEVGESDEAALARELREEMGIAVEVGDRCVHVEHAYEGYDIDFPVYRCRLLTGPVRDQELRRQRTPSQAKPTSPEDAPSERPEAPAAEQAEHRAVSVSVTQSLITGRFEPTALFPTASPTIPPPTAGSDGR